MPSEKKKQSLHEDQNDQAHKRFKHNFHDKLKKDVENMKYSENSSHTNLFRLQISELLKEISPSEAMLEKCDSGINFLIKNLKSLKIKKECEYSDLKIFDGKISFPLSFLCEKMEGVYSFFAPTNINIIGSYATNTYISTDSKISIDISVEMPKEFFTERDYLNYRYFVKRNMYLAHVYLQLKNKEKFSDLTFELVSDYASPYKPSLKINFEKSLEFRLHFVPHPNSFKLQRFNPNQSNVRSAWFFEKFATSCKIDALNLQLDNPTPNYNLQILSDLRANVNNQLIKNHITTTGVKEAIKLFKVWMLKRELNKGHGGFDGFTILMFVTHLILTERINPVMNEYQIFRTILINLSQANWESVGLWLKKTEVNESNQTVKREDFQKNFDVVFNDQSSYLNICWRMSLNVFLRIKSEAVNSLKILDSNSDNAYEELFIKNHSIEMCFDSLLRINSFENNDYYDVIVEKTSNQLQLMDYFNKSDVLSLKLIQNILYKALNGRASYIFIELFKDLKWDVSSQFPNKKNHSIIIGISFDQEYDQVLIKGPSSTSSEAKEFRDFWGEKSELRRFHDTTICETVFFDAPNIESKRHVYSEIVKHIFQRHLSIEEKNLQFIDRQLNSLLNLPTGIIENYGTGEEKIANVINIYNELAAILKNLRDLPLSINNINGISSIFRYTDVFAPLPCFFNYEINAEKNMHFKLKGRNIPKYPPGSVITPYIKPLKIACQLESNGKWPDNLECIKHLKTAFYLKIAESVRETLNLTAYPHLGHCDIVYKGIVFRLSVFTMNELLCMKTLINKQGVILTNESPESVLYEKNMILIPKLNSFLHSIQQKNSIFSSLCRIVKRWLSSQLLIDYFEEEAVDLICAYLFVNPHTYEVPKSIIIGFLRFLDFMSNFDWKNKLMIIDFNNELQENEINELKANFKMNRFTLPPVSIITPFDVSKKFSIWTLNKPNMQELCRTVLLSRQALKNLKKSIMSFESNESFRNLFRLNPKMFDVVISLKPQYCVKAYQKVDISKGTFLPHYKAYSSNETDKPLPVVDFNPVDMFVNDLRSAYGELANFYSDIYGDTEVYVLWKPNVLVRYNNDRRNMKFGLINQTKNSFELNLLAIIEDFKTIGKELVEKVTIKKESLVFK